MAKTLDKTLIAIGKRLSELRVKKGHQTVKEFVIRYKLPAIQYWRVERGRTNVTLKSLIKILDIHKVNIVDFFNSLKIEKGKN